MTIPGFQDLMLPVLQEIGQCEELRKLELVNRIADKLALSDDERRTRLANGQTVLRNRVAWAVSHLGRARLLDNTRRGYWRITDRGRFLLDEQPLQIDIRFLRRFEDYRTGRASAVEDAPGAEPVDDALAASPHELMQSAYREIEAALRDEIIGRILSRDSGFFEGLVRKVLLAMGYGGGDPTTAEVVGGGGDEGVDVVVRQDPLGLDRVYVQAKRYARDRTVGPGTVHALAGSLGIFKASKGLLVTTAGFTRGAREAAEKVANRVVLIDGDELAGLMIRYGVGVRIEETFHVKKVDEDFFLE